MLVVAQIGVNNFLLSLILCGSYLHLQNACCISKSKMKQQQTTNQSWTYLDLVVVLESASLLIS